MEVQLCYATKHATRLAFFKLPAFFNYTVINLILKTALSGINL